MIYYQPHKQPDAEYFRNCEKYWRRTVLPVNGEVPHKFISVVTRCMDRLHDLRITLPKNLKDNADYKEAEFVVVDYGSRDGLEDWMKLEMMEYIESGRLKYYRTTEPQFFCPNHAQNVTFRVANGPLVANVDSDNFTQPGYLARLNQCAARADSKLLVVPANFLLPGSKKLLLKGRFAVYRDDIERWGGFDEDLDEGFSNDDLNFVFRAMIDGCTIVRYESSYSEYRLPTTDDQRVSLVKNKNYKKMREVNGLITWAKLAKGVVTVNRNKHWGKAKLVKNFKEMVEV